MRRIVSLILVLGLCLSLCACSKSEAVKAVESLIKEIGPVSVSSSEKLKEAENAYSALSAEEQKQVRNYETLEKARKDFNDLGILLTVDNYENYLNVSCERKLFDATDFASMIGVNDVDTGNYVYYGLETILNISGKTDNYDYNDVVVTVKISGYYVPQSSDTLSEPTEEYWLENMVDIDETLTVTTDIIGSGSASSVINIPDGYWVWDSSVNLSYEVINVSGILTK